MNKDNAVAVVLLVAFGLLSCVGSAQMYGAWAPGRPIGSLLGGLVLAVLGLITLMVGLIIGVGAVRQTMWRMAREKAARREVARILGNGAPQTLAEYLNVFPDACGRCGSRDRLHYFEAGSYSQYQYLQDLPDIDLWQCARCGYGDAFTSSSAEVSAERVSSPYLSVGQADAILDWPYQPAEDNVPPPPG